MMGTSYLGKSTKVDEIRRGETPSQQERKHERGPVNIDMAVLFRGGGTWF